MNLKKRENQSSSSSSSSRSPALMEHRKNPTPEKGCLNGVVLIDSMSKRLIGGWNLYLPVAVLMSGKVGRLKVPWRNAGWSAAEILRFDRDWKKIEAFVGSQTVIQIRSHAQKYFLKVQKSGASEHVPPPRPKRKASHLYPQKAQKTGPSSTLLEPGFVVRSDSLSVPANPTGNAVFSGWAYGDVPGFSISHGRKDDIQLLGTAMSKNCSSSSNECIPRMQTTNETSDQGKEMQNMQTRVMPDFAQVYSFIGSIFDPNSSDHLHRLKLMDPINVETAMMLMKNLSINLISPECEDHRRLLLSNNLAAEKDNTSPPFGSDEGAGSAISSAYETCY